MFGDIGWAELLLIGIVALVVIGPEDLPDMFRQIGRFTAKLRQMSREFSRAMEQAAKETGIKDVAKDLKAVASPGALGLNKVKEAADRFEKWDPMANASKPTSFKPLVPPPMPATPVAHPGLTPEPVAGAFGPATQALADKQAAKKAILAETSARLKAVDSDAAAEPASAPAPHTKAAADIAVQAVPRLRIKSDKAATAKPVAAKPRAPRKTTKVDQQ